VAPSRGSLGPPLRECRARSIRVSVPGKVWRQRPAGGPDREPRNARVGVAPSGDTTIAPSSGEAGSSHVRGQRERARRVPRDTTEPPGALLGVGTPGGSRSDLDGGGVNGSEWSAPELRGTSAGADGRG